jgi:uncharacterized membrane protein HdeD (DUF308 family)
MNKGTIAVAAILGVIFIIVGIMYATQPASALPSFFPGYEAAGHSKHMKHAIASIVVGLACFVFAWFQSGSKATSAKG